MFYKYLELNEFNSHYLACLVAIFSYPDKIHFAWSVEVQGSKSLGWVLGNDCDAHASSMKTGCSGAVAA